MASPPPTTLAVWMASRKEPGPESFVFTTRIAWTTVTMKPHILLCPLGVRASQLTLVMPSGNVEPDGGVQLTLTGPSHPGLTRGRGNVPAALLLRVKNRWSPGQLMIACSGTHEARFAPGMMLKLVP